VKENEFKDKLEKYLKQENFDKALDMLTTKGIKSKEDYELVTAILNLKFETNEEIKKADLEKALKIVKRMNI